MGYELRETSWGSGAGRALSGLIGASLALALLQAPVAAQPRAQAQKRAAELAPSDRVLEHTLQNGWRFLIYPRHEAPTISFETYVAVGAAHDPEGMSGMANLVKNLLFKGSSRIGTNNWEQEAPALTAVDEANQKRLTALAGGTAEEQAAASAEFDRARVRAASWVEYEEFSRILEGAGSGSTLNGYTDQDSTRFVVSLPSNQTELWCWMESERFRDPIFREFYVERAALLEDWQSRAGADPVGVIGEALRASAYGEHPLGRPSIGHAADIENLQRSAAIAFFQEHYSPRQLVTAIAGDVNPDQLIPFLEKYFGSIPSRPALARSLPPLPKQEGEQRVEVVFDGEPRLWIAWHVPPLAHPDSAALEIAIRLLGYARSSRLEKRLKRSNSLVSELAVNHAWGGNRIESLAQVRCAPNPGVSLDELETSIHEEIELLAREGPEREELDGVKRVASADFFRSLRKNEALTAGLASAWMMTGHWRHFFEREIRLNAVQPKEVQRVLQKWFRAENRTVAILAPAPPEKADEEKP